MIGEYLTSVFSLEGKVVMATGGAGGIGFELCKGMAEAGAQVAICDLDLNAAESGAEKIRALGGDARAFRLNVTERDSIRECLAAVLEAYGEVNVLANIAGINKREGILDVEERTYDRARSLSARRSSSR